MVDQHHNTKLRRTRIVCISDTHNCTVKLPKGDILIHAGDITNQGSYSEVCFKRIAFCNWLVPKLTELRSSLVLSSG